MGSGVCVEGTVAAVSVFPQDLLPWAPNQPDNWQDNEDCVQLRGMDHHEPGKLNDDFCTSTKEFICKKGLNGDVSAPPLCYLCSNFYRCIFFSQPRDKDRLLSLPPLDRVRLILHGLQLTT